MAYENRNAAYDLSLFDEDVAYSNGSALPKRNEQEVHKKQTKKKAKTIGQENHPVPRAHALRASGSFPFSALSFQAAG